MAEAKFLTLDVTNYVEETSEPDPEDSWDRASTSTSWDVHGIKLSSKDGRYALPPDFAVAKGDQVFACWAIYSTGDSFGSDDASDLEVVSFNKIEANAQANRLAAAEASGWEMKITLDGGGEVTSHVPWNGYFERLNSVEVRAFTVD